MQQIFKKPALTLKKALDYPKQLLLMVNQRPNQATTFWVLSALTFLLRFNFPTA
jgi:hypothetical protein